MLRRMILINSANFQFADIDLSKEIFFVGDNASGKTTTTRALHFLYNSDGQKLGIPRGKDSFNKHYFPSDDSYIIYVFETFFIFTYSRNNTIKRWFCKQLFDIDKVIKDGELLEFKVIEKYIKGASLFFKPSTIDEYTSILYGNNKKYRDFTIAKIENYKIFLDIFNMIFNIDKAIVTASDIKKAIQKSLDRKDDTLSIDYEDFIRKLNSFTRSYHFFKLFDSNRVNLQKALLLKSELLSLEKSLTTTHKAINYRYSFEIEAFNKQHEYIKEYIEEIKKYKNRVKSISKLYEKFDDRVSIKISSLEKEITRLEILKEKFDPIDITENTLHANKHSSIKKDLDDKKISLYKLTENLTSAQKEIENQIEQIRHKIKTLIPNEAKQTIYKLSEIEKANHENELLEIQKEFNLLEEEIVDKIKAFNDEIDALNDVKNGIDLEILREQKIMKQEYLANVKPLETQEEVFTQNIKDFETRKREVQEKKFSLSQKIEEHSRKYQKLRKSNAKNLASKRLMLNNKILNARAILNPKADSFHEFLSREIDSFEEEVYPVIDKDLLKISALKLNPQIIDGLSPLGFKIDTSSLNTIPTKDEAVKIIQDTRDEKYRLLISSKEIYRLEIAKFDEIKNNQEADLEALDKEIQNIIDDIASVNAAIEKNSILIIDKQEKLKSQLEMINEQKKEKRDEITNKIALQQSKIKSCKGDVRELEKKKIEDTKKDAKKRDFNITIIKKQELAKANSEIVEQNKIIEGLSKDIDSLDEDDLIKKTTEEVRLLENNMKIATDAIRFLEEYEEVKDSIALLPSREIIQNRLKKSYRNRKHLIKRVELLVQEHISSIVEKKEKLESTLKQYEIGIKKVQKQNIKIGDDKIENEEFLSNLIDAYEEYAREYRNEKSKFRELIDKLKRLEVHSIIELNFNLENFSEVQSISELENIMESLQELSSFEKNKYESEKKRSHNSFDTFLRLTIPSKLQSFDDLEGEFEKAKNSINRTLSHADFGVIRDIKLITDSSKKRNDSIAALLQELSKKVHDTVGLYSNKSLFYFDISKSVNNIEDIQMILEEIRKKGSNGAINLFDTIDLSISYIENGKKVENKLNIKDESSSGGNILLKVAIAMSILSRYAKKTSDETPFFLIIDEISKLQSKNQDLIREYINDNGFKTLFITPDPAYPNPQRAIYYTFKNIQEEGETLEIRQMNIV